MKIMQGKRTKGGNWLYTNKQPLSNPLVLVFSSRYFLDQEGIYTEIKGLFPSGHIVFASTAGEILSNRVFENTITFTAIEFERSTFVVHTENILSNKKNARKTGEKLAKKFPKENLKHLFVLSEGSFINGAALLEGLESQVKNGATITGGMCGDDERFERTIASYNEVPKQGEIIAIGFYGNSLEVSYASYGGWTAFGPERIVTKSRGNVVWEVDNVSLLDLYKNYLGEKATDLPKSTLLYPLSVKFSAEEEGIIRTILGTDEKNNAMILAGDIPEGSIVQLMMTNVDSVVDGALKAAELAMDKRKNFPELAFLISCIGRKIFLGQQTEEEIEEVQYTIGADVPMCGFYAYGEMAPFKGTKKCVLHNQTMTLTLISE